MPRRILIPAEILTEEEHAEIDAVLVELGEEAKSQTNQAPENLRGRVRRTPEQIAEQWEAMK